MSPIIMNAFKSHKIKDYRFETFLETLIPLERLMFGYEDDPTALDELYVIWLSEQILSKMRDQYVSKK